MKDKLPRPSALPATRHAQDPGSPAASPSSQDASALGEVSAPADLVTAKERFDFVLNEQLDLYRKFQKQGAHRKEREVLKDMCRAAEALAKVECAEVRRQAHGVQPNEIAWRADCGKFGRIELPELTPAQQEQQAKARSITPASRRAVGEMFDSARIIAQLEEKLMANKEVTAAPSESERGVGES